MDGLALLQLAVSVAVKDFVCDQVFLVVVVVIQCFHAVVFLLLRCENGGESNSAAACEEEEEPSREKKTLYPPLDFDTQVFLNEVQVVLVQVVVICREGKWQKRRQALDRFI